MTRERRSGPEGEAGGMVRSRVRTDIRLLWSRRFSCRQSFQSSVQPVMPQRAAVLDAFRGPSRFQQLFDRASGGSRAGGAGSPVEVRAARLERGPSGRSLVVRKALA